MKSVDKDDADVGWKVTHKQVCDLGPPGDGMKLHWPQVSTPAQDKYLMAGGLTPRELELVRILDLMFPPCAGTEVIDANQSMEWVLSSLLLDKHCNGWKQPSDETVHSTLWLPKVPCDVGSSKLVLRHSTPVRCSSKRGMGQAVQARQWRRLSVRAVEPFEEFALQGWSPDLWRVPLFSTPATSSELALLSDMAGVCLCCVYFSRPAVRVSIAGTQIYTYIHIYIYIYIYSLGVRVCVCVCVCVCV